MAAQIENQRLLEEAQASIERLPDVTVYSELYEGRPGLTNKPDLELSVDVQGHDVKILIEAKAHGYPRDVRQAISQLRSLQAQANGTPVVLMVAAPAISLQTRDYLRREGIGYWDQGGSLYLKLPWAIFFIDRPAPAAPRRKSTNTYRGRTAQVLHALLMEPGRPWHVHELSEHAEVSPYTVHQVFGYLEEQLWMEKTGTGPHTIRVLSDPGALLDTWAGHHSLKEYRFLGFHRWTQSPRELRRQVTAAMDRLNVEYALTLASGADLVAPFLTNVEKVSVLVPANADIERIAAEAGLSPAETGENVTFLTTPNRSPLMFRQQIDGLSVASDIQLYLDLWASPLRGKEQASHLRAERLSF